MTLGTATAAAATAVALAGPAAAEPARIHDIQGAAHLSPLAGRQVEGVTGVVTAVDGGGFWMQDPAPDDDPATSEAIFVFTRSRPAAAIGDAVTVAGTVTEFRPGGEATNLTTTEITSPTVTVTGPSGLPAATVIGEGGRAAPGSVIDDDADGDVEAGGSFDADTDGIDFYESLEGMRVTLNDPVAVGLRNNFGELPVLADGGAGASVRTNRGGIALRSGDPNPERVLLDDAYARTPTVDVGDRLSTVTGVMTYSFGGFKLAVQAAPTVTPGAAAPERAKGAERGELAVATFNVENLHQGSPDAKFAALAGQIVDGLRSPDILTAEEIQDDSGPANDGTVTDAATVAKLTAAIEAAGGPAYAWRSIAPVNNADGGQPGGNIRVGFLFRTDRGLEFTDRPGGDATTPVRVRKDARGPLLSASPGRLDPANEAFTNSRKPLAGEFTWRGRRLFVVANHWNSKGGDQPAYSRFQPPVQTTQPQRIAQAEVVAGFVRSVLAADRQALVVVAGDLNDFDFSTPIERLTDAGMTDLPARLPAPERYTYVFEGNSQVLDHILLSPRLAGIRPAYDVVHMNAEYADQSSDHDPSVVRLSLR
ncbi:MAG: endonuclease/exonuclease/phosphatase [Streptosporangiales bacterium]|nr:endonuclease/exonuclease/phosphatase [Streptosporangiales bacterium]